MILHLPYPPTTNNLFLNVGKRRVRTKRYDQWLSAAQAALATQSFERIEGQYRLTIIAQRPDKRRRDVGNLEKPISDLLVKAGVVADDSDAQSIFIAWNMGGVTPGGAVVVSVEPVSAPQFHLGRAA